MTPPNPSSKVEQWLRSAGIIELVQGQAVFGELESLPIAANQIEHLRGVLPSQLARLSDSLGTFRALTKYLLKHAANATEIQRLLNGSGQLEKLLKALDLGSEVQTWLIAHDVRLNSLKKLPEISEFRQWVTSEIATVAAHDSGRSSASRKIIAMQRSMMIDIAIDHIYDGASIEVTLQRNSLLADAVISWCYERCFQILANKFGTPQLEGRAPAHCSVLASLELGGQELNFDSSVQLLMLAECSGRTNAQRSIGNRQFFERLAHDLDDMLNGADPEHRLYSVRWNQIPSLNQSMVQDYDAAAQYYDNKGRTWERQSLIQLRTVAGSIASGESFVNSISPWIYRRYIVEADEAGVAVLTRKILRQLSGREYLKWDDANPHQGVLLIARTVHLLLLTYGHQNDSLRSLNTFDAIRRLEEHQKLTKSQADSLIENLRAFDRLVLESSLDKRPIKEGRFHYRRQRSAKTFEATKNTLFDILLDEQPKSSWPPEESDLIMDPSPPRAWVAHVLRRYNVDDPQAAYDLLSQMGQEEVFCLSTRQCRHQLAKIAPSLLHVVSSTPSPLNTLHNLNRISQSLGGKAVLWQLFSDTPSTMNAMVRLAASSPYLSNQLTHSPGMIDELVDSLLLGRLPSHRDIHGTFSKYTNLESSLETLAEFKRALILRIGIRHLLSKSNAMETQSALSEIPDAIIGQMVSRYWNSHEMSRSKAYSGANAHRFAIFAIGQYGARRLNFRDKLPMLLVYRSNEGESNNDSGLLIQHVYDKLGQSILQQIQSTSVGDRMYEAMFRWGPMQGRSQLAMSDRDYRVLFSAANLSDKMATLTMRPIIGDASFARAFQESVRRDWESIGNAGLLAMLKESFNRLRWQSMEDRRSVAMDLRLGELRELLVISEALVQTVAGSIDSLTQLDLKLSQLEIATQLVCKSSTNELRKDSDAQRRLAYLIHKSTWKDVLESLESIEQEAIRSLDAFLSAAERRVRMPVSQMDSHGSNLFVE